MSKPPRKRSSRLFQRAQTESLVSEETPYRSAVTRTVVPVVPVETDTKTISGIKEQSSVSAQVDIPISTKATGEAPPRQATPKPPSSGTEKFSRPQNLQTPLWDFLGDRPLGGQPDSLVETGQPTATDGDTNSDETQPDLVTTTTPSQDVRTEGANRELSDVQVPTPQETYLDPLSQPPSLEETRLKPQIEFGDLTSVEETVSSSVEVELAGPDNQRDELTTLDTEVIDVEYDEVEGASDSADFQPEQEEPHLDIIESTMLGDLLDEASKNPSQNTKFEVPSWGTGVQGLNDEDVPIRAQSSEAKQSIAQDERVDLNEDARPLGALGADIADILVRGVDDFIDDEVALDASELEEYEARRWSSQAGKQSQVTQSKQMEVSSSSRVEFVNQDINSGVDGDTTDEVLFDSASQEESSEVTVQSVYQDETSDHQIDTLEDFEDIPELNQLDFDEDLDAYINAYKGGNIERWGKPGALAFVVLLVVWVAFGDDSPTESVPSVQTTEELAAGYGRLIIRSDVSVVVYVDGENRGVTPTLTPIDITAGVHLIKMIEAESGVESQELSLDVQAGKTQSIRYERGGE